MQEVRQGRVIFLMNFFAVLMPVETQEAQRGRTT
jgi:hypothetical protein